MTNTNTTLATDDEGFSNNSTRPDADWYDKDAVLVVTKNGVRTTKNVHFIGEV